MEQTMTENVTNQLSKHWQKFLLKFEEINNLDPSEWKEVHLLSFFCKRYEQAYSQKYSLSFKTTAPSRCPEINVIKRVQAMLNTTNTAIVKEYIFWVFDVKIVPSKTKIRSINYLLTNGYGNEFNQFWINKNKVDKTTELPDEYKQIALKLGVQVSTYGDLAFAKMALESYDNDSTEPYKKLFHTLKVIGFNEDVLERMK